MCELVRSLSVCLLLSHLRRLSSQQWKRSYCSTPRSDLVSSTVSGLFYHVQLPASSQCCHHRKQLYLPKEGTWVGGRRKRICARQVKFQSHYSSTTKHLSAVFHWHFCDVYGQPEFWWTEMSSGKALHFDHSLCLAPVPTAQCLARGKCKTPIYGRRGGTGGKGCSDSSRETDHT